MRLFNSLIHISAIVQHKTAISLHPRVEGQLTPPRWVIFSKCFRLKWFTFAQLGIAGWLWRGGFGSQVDYGVGVGPSEALQAEGGGPAIIFNQPSIVKMKSDQRYQHTRHQHQYMPDLHSDTKNYTMQLHRHKTSHWQISNQSQGKKNIITESLQYHSLSSILPFAKAHKTYI